MSKNTERRAGIDQIKSEIKLKYPNATVIQVRDISKVEWHKRNDSPKEEKASGLGTFECSIPLPSVKK